MKKQLIRKSFWQSLWSLPILGVFILSALATEGVKDKVTKEDQGGGVIKETTTFSGGENRSRTVTGKIDEYGVRDGWIETVSVSSFGTQTENVYWEDGYRKGTATTTYSDGREPTTRCWSKGISYTCTKSEQIFAEDVSAFQVLFGKYPWFTDELIVFGYDNAYLEAYLDTLETILDELGDDPQEFDNYYGDAVDSLTYTPYDSIIQFNSRLTDLQGTQELKRDEFRRAVIDRNRTMGKATYDMLEDTYPGYLGSIIELGIEDTDFERFCHVTDSLMDENNTLYGSLDPAHTFFVDSVDERLYRAMSYILNYEDTTSSALKSLKIKIIFNDRNDIHSIYREARSLLVQSAIDSTIQNAAGGVLYFMLLRFYVDGDMIYRGVKEAWFNNRGVASLPTVLTEFSGNISATSVSLLGEVLEDGGAEVTSRGIAWADFYNPETIDNSEMLGTGLGTFELSLSNLTEGNTYYARSFATNSAGTAYGNCLKFTAGEAVGINEPELFVQDFTVYPNPAARITSFSFDLEAPAVMALTFVNLKGQAVYHHDLGRLLPGENRVELDLSGLPNGLYACQLCSMGRIKGEQKMLIMH